MASLNPFFCPNYGDKPWVDQIRETVKTQIAVTIDTPPVSIFEIPKHLKAEKLEAYIPQQVGLGPNHHFHPELYHKVEQKKLTALKRVIKPHQIHDYEHELVEKVKKIVPLIRDCYDSYHDGDDNMLAWLFAIDGMFLIDQLNIAYSNNGFVTKAKDLIMLENQIPLIALKEIQNALSGQEDFLESNFRSFCKSNSTFVLSEKNIDFNRVNHLLDYMYNSIVNNVTLTSSEVDFMTNNGSESPEKDAKLELVEAVIRFLGVIPGGQSIGQVFEFIKKKLGEVAEKKATAEEIKVPSVSELHKVARVEFRLSPKNEGIRNLNFVQGKVRCCYLPLMTLNKDSEVVLRNLVAYERLMAKNSFSCGPCGYGLELTEYVDFMCGIIDHAKDVKLLRDQKIIEGDLSDEEIVKLFNGIGKSRVKMSSESELKKTVDRLNMVYESTTRIWVQRIIERQFLVWAKIITFLISISSVVIFIREVYLIVYGLKASDMMLARFIRARLSGLPFLFFGPKGPKLV